MDLSSCRRTCPFTQYLNIFALLCRTDRRLVGCSPISVYSKSVIFSLPEVFSFLRAFLVCSGANSGRFSDLCPRAAFHISIEGAALLHYCAIALLLSCVRTPCVGAYRAAALSTQILSLHTHSHNLWDAPPHPTLLLSALIILSLPSKKEHSGVNYSLRS